MEYAAGIIIWKKEDGKTKFFVCSPGGPAWENRENWNFPKGHMEFNESPFETAIREFQEETGVCPASLIRKDYQYHGLVKQRSSKSVYVFSRELAGEKLGDNCFSNTFVWEEDGKEYPEIGKYAWLTYDEIKKRGGVRAFYYIFEQIETWNARNC